MRAVVHVWVLFLVALCATPVGADSVGLRALPAHLPDGSDVSGDAQTVHVGGSARLTVEVQDSSGAAVADVRVRFERIDTVPIPLAEIRTDARGHATVDYPVGARAGTQTVAARILDEGLRAQDLVLRVHVRDPQWALMMVLALGGGLSLFLIGMEEMSGALRRSAGGRLRTMLAVFTRNRFVAVLTGAVVTTLIQSSSATTVLLVSFVQAGLMSFSRTLGVILGADIGTTVTVQLIAFKLTDFALPIIGIGFALRYLVGRSKWNDLGEAILGFGMLFFGLAVMAEAMEPLRNYPPFVTRLHTLQNPVLGILVGTLFTALVQSSAAFIGVVLVIAQQGLIGLEQGVPLIFGANIGTCITAGLASLRGTRAAKRVAVAHVAFKVGGVLLVLGWIGPFAELARGIGGAEGSVPRQIANAHTLFNVGLAMVFLPFTGLTARLLERFVPDRPISDSPMIRARYLDEKMLRTPILALSLAKVEILDLGRRVQAMARRMLNPLVENDPKTLDELHAEEERVDALYEQIHDYLLKIGQQHIGREQMGEVYLMLHTAVQFENMADVIDKELRTVARRRIERGVHFSPRGRSEIEAYHLKMLKQISRSLDAFAESSLETARRITVKQAKYDGLEVDYRKAHFERLRNGVSETVDSSEIHLDVMDGLQKITNHATNIARAMLARDAEENGAAQTADPSGPAA